MHCLGIRLSLQPLLNRIVTHAKVLANQTDTQQNMLGSLLRGLEQPGGFASTLREMRKMVRESAKQQLGSLSRLEGDYLDVLLNTVDLKELLDDGGKLAKRILAARCVSTLDLSRSAQAPSLEP